jgi:two-component system phosphate regulon sensor histidine kinase PhoR
MADDPVAVEALSAIERQSNRLFRLIANVLRESNVEHDDTGNAVFMFPFGDLVDEVVADFHDIAKRIRSDISGELSLVTVDRRRTHDVLVNLVDNALKYSSAPSPVTIGANSDGSSLTFWVSDAGIGIESGDLPRVFDRFYQVDQSATRSYGGVGLGLHIVSELVEGMGGRIEVQSTPGTGSTFTVTLPFARPQDLGTNQPRNAAAV